MCYVIIVCTHVNVKFYFLQMYLLYICNVYIAQ